MYKVFSLCAIFVMAKIWRTFQNKLAKLLEFSLGEKKKKSHFFVQKKNTTYLWQMGLFFFMWQLCDCENLATFQNKLAKLVDGFSILKKEIPIFLFRKRTPLIYGKWDLVLRLIDYF